MGLPTSGECMGTCLPPMSSYPRGARLLSTRLPSRPGPRCGPHRLPGVRPAWPWPRRSSLVPDILGGLPGGNGWRRIPHVATPPGSGAAQSPAAASPVPRSCRHLVFSAYPFPLALSDGHRKGKPVLPLGPGVRLGFPLLDEPAGHADAPRLIRYRGIPAGLLAVELHSPSMPACPFRRFPCHVPPLLPLIPSPGLGRALRVSKAGGKGHG